MFPVHSALPSCGTLMRHQISGGRIAGVDNLAAMVRDWRGQATFHDRNVIQAGDF